MEGYVNGYLERTKGGSYEGQLRIDSVDISPIEGMYFERDGKKYLWLKRRPLLEFDYETQSYKKRDREPRWEAYLQKQGGETVAYKGTFAFLRFKYSIVGVWDRVLGTDKHQRLNFFVERLPMNEQTIIQGINERKRRKNADS